MGSTETDLIEPTTQEAIQAVRDNMNRVRGGLFSAIELAGLPTKRENALKGLIRQLTYDTQTNIEAALRGHE